MLTSTDIFLGLISSTLTSDLYGLMRRILYLIFIATHCKFIMPLLKHRLTTNGHVCGVSYLYAVCLLIINLSLTL